MRILDLFSGTHSGSKVFDKDEIITVDIDNKYNPTHLVDILEFDYSKYPKNHFEYIHASPPCILYSQCQITFYGRKKRHNITKEMVIWNKELHNECIIESDKLVLKALEIIEYFEPKYYTIENPYHGQWCSIHKRPFMAGIPYARVDYCMYGYHVKKPTIFFNNFKLDLTRCNKKHTHTHWDRMSRNKYDRYVIPSELIGAIKTQIEKADMAAADMAADKMAVVVS